jgi:hypothetical protein
MNFVNNWKSGFQPDSAGDHLVRRGTDRQAGSLAAESAKMADFQLPRHLRAR